MCDNIKVLLAKCWKNELVDLAPGTHYVDEMFTVHMCGSVQKQSDAMVAPTTVPAVDSDYCLTSGKGRDNSGKLSQSVAGNSNAGDQRRTV